MATIASTQMVRGGFWIRASAYVVDTVILIIAYGVLWFAVSTAVSEVSAIFIATGVLSIVFSLAYFIYFWSSAGAGQTLGMRIFGLKVVKTDGSPLGGVGALVRYAGLIIALLPAAIGVIWVAFDANKQGWHDKIAGTYVVKAR